MVKFNENAIREAAYYNWQNAGCPQGKDEYFWSMAIEQLNKKSTSSACCSTKKTCTSKSTSASASLAKKKVATKK